MAELTATELARLRRKIGDSAGTVFTTDELNDIYTEAESSFDRTLLLVFEELLFSAARFNDYTVGQTQEKKSQVFDHLNKLVADLRGRVDRRQQIKIVGMRAVPPREKDEPWS